MSEKPYILNIGGFDPCNGAGITADLKTFTVLDVYALTVQTCLTIQNESEIRKIYWFTIEQIKEQIDVLAKLYHWEYVKISLTNGLKNALAIIEYIHQVSDAKIIWDPVMKSSSGYDFYSGINGEILDNILNKVYLVTPNWNELDKWEKNTKPLAVASKKSRITNIYLKGGHNKVEKGVDYLFLNSGKIEKLIPKGLSQYEKHGSGCVFASALVAFLAHGNDLHEASKQAKEVILKFLESTETLLGDLKPDRSGIAKPDRSETAKSSRSIENEKLKPSKFYHIYNRGNNEEDIFKEEDNYIYFRSLIGRHILPFANVLAYCFLPNHFHLVIQVKGEGEIDKEVLTDLSQPFSNLFNAFSRAMNKKYKRTGSLFQRTFKRKVIDDNSYLIDCILYVNTNAEHHKISTSNKLYEFSSYSTTLDRNDVLVNSDMCFDLFEGAKNFVSMHKEKKELIDGEFEN